MGYIILNNIVFSPAASVNQTVRVEYRLSSSAGAFTLVNNAAPVLANGNFSPAIQIENLINGETYTVKITSLCNGAVVTQNFKVGNQCTSFTVQANIGGATVEWYDCNTGSPLSRFIAEGEQHSFCTNTQDGYIATFGSVTQISNNGDCQN